MKNDSFEERRQHLSSLSDEELKNLFWSLTDQLVSPLIDLAKKNTSPSIERSVLLRMGFSSIESSQIVSKILEEQMLSYGAGNLVLRLSLLRNIDVREAGSLIMNGHGFHELRRYFEGASSL